MEKPGKIIDTEEIIDPGEEAVRTLHPGKITNTEKILDTGEDGKDAVPTLNPDSDKIIDTGEDANLRLHPGKAIIDTAKNTKKNSLRMEKPGQITEHWTLERLPTLQRLSTLTEQKALIIAMLTEED